MLSVIRPVFEAVKEGRILNKIKHLHLSFLAGINPSRQSGQVLDKNGLYYQEIIILFCYYFKGTFVVHLSESEHEYLYQ